MSIIPKIITPSYTTTISQNNFYSFIIFNKKNATAQTKKTQTLYNGQAIKTLKTAYVSIRLALKVSTKQILQILPRQILNKAGVVGN